MLTPTSTTLGINASSGPNNPAEAILERLLSGFKIGVELWCKRLEHSTDADPLLGGKLMPLIMGAITNICM